MKTSAFFLAILLILFLNTSCKISVSSTNSSDDVNKAVVSISLNNLEELSENSEKFINTEIILMGEFLGFSGQKCSFLYNFSQMITRSDWIFSDTKYCIYVTGGTPDGLVSTEKENIGTKIKLIAYCKLKKDKMYLEYVSSEIIK